MQKARREAFHRPPLSSYGASCQPTAPVVIPIWCQSCRKHHSRWWVRAHLQLVLVLLVDPGQQLGFPSVEGINEGVTLGHQAGLELHAVLLWVRAEHHNPGHISTLVGKPDFLLWYHMGHFYTCCCTTATHKSIALACGMLTPLAHSKCGAAGGEQVWSVLPHPWIYPWQRLGSLLLPL